MAEEKRKGEGEKIDGRVASLGRRISSSRPLRDRSLRVRFSLLPTPRSNPRSSSRQSELSRNRGNTSLCKVVVR